MERTMMLQHFFLFLYDLYSGSMWWGLSIQDTDTSGHASLKNSPTILLTLSDVCADSIGTASVLTHVRRSYSSKSSCSSSSVVITYLSVITITSNSTFCFFTTFSPLYWIKDVISVIRSCLGLLHFEVIIWINSKYYSPSSGLDILDFSLYKSNYVYS